MKAVKFFCFPSKWIVFYFLLFSSHFVVHAYMEELMDRCTIRTSLDVEGRILDQ